MANANLGVEAAPRKGTAGRSAGDEGHALERDRGRLEIPASSDGDRVGDRVDPRHIAGLA